MNHKIFRLTTVSLTIPIIVSICLFNYFSVTDGNYYVKLITKLIPLFVMSILTIFYMFRYRITLYSISMLITFFLSLLGDFFLVLYDPKLDDISVDKQLYLLVGGSSFFIARLTLLPAFVLYPSNNLHIIRYDIKKMIASHIYFHIPFISVAIFFLIYGNYQIMYVMVFLYLTITFGFQLSYSFLRIKEIPTESFNASLFGFLGVLFFNLSDVLLLFAILTEYLPDHFTILADDIYWLGMYFLMISIVRFSNEADEKMPKYYPMIN